MAEPGSTSAGGTITSLLRDAREGDRSALDKVFQCTYAELRLLAQGQIQRARSSRPSIDATALVHAACDRLLGAERLDAENRRHFFFLLGRAMHDVLVEEARAAAAKKRGGGLRRVRLVDVGAAVSGDTVDVLDLHDALEELRDQDSDAAEVVKLRFFADRTLEETADLLGWSLSAVRRHWDYAKAWLNERMSRSPGD